MAGALDCTLHDFHGDTLSAEVPVAANVGAPFINILTFHFVKYFLIDFRRYIVVPLNYNLFFIQIYTSVY